MSDTTNNEYEDNTVDEDEAARIYAEVLGDEPLPSLDPEPAPVEVKKDARPNKAKTTNMRRTAIVQVDVPDINTIEFDDDLIDGLDLGSGDDRATASRILFSHYSGAALGIPKGPHRSNWNSLIHTRISMHLGRLAAAQRTASTEDTLRKQVSSHTIEKQHDIAALSAQSVLRVLKDTVLTEDGIDLARLEALLKEV